MLGQARGTGISGLVQQKTNNGSRAFIEIWVGDSSAHQPLAARIRNSAFAT